MLKIFIGVFSSLAVAAFVATSVRADIVSSDSVSVTRYYAYGDYGSGDVIFQFAPASVLVGCDGAWIAASQPGAKNLVATVISAKLAASAVTLYVNNAAIWPGSSARYCKVDAMGLR